MSAIDDQIVLWRYGKFGVVGATSDYEIVAENVAVPRHRLRFRFAFLGKDRRREVFAIAQTF